MKIVSLFVFFSLLLSCATPEVVVVKKPDDEKKNCEELENLVAETQKFKRDALFEKENTGGNMARMLLFWPAMATTYYNADKAIRAANDRTFHKNNEKKSCKNIDLINSEISEIHRNSCGATKYLREMYRRVIYQKRNFQKAKY